MGWRAILADAETRLEPDGPLSLAEARRSARAYLEERLARLGPHDPATRRASLRLALGRVEERRELS